MKEAVRRSWQHLARERIDDLHPACWQDVHAIPDGRVRSVNAYVTIFRPARMSGRSLARCCSFACAGTNIQEFAAKLKLSVSTVSKALNGREDVSADTRKRVMQAAELHGFSPDPAARRLRRQSADTIAFVVSPPQTSFAHPFFLYMLMGANEAMDNTGYQVIVASARSVETEIDVIKRLIDRQRVDALLFGRTRR